jgi:hypothetical protein
MTDEARGLDREPKVAFFFERGISINKLNYVIVRCGETISNLWDCDAQRTITQQISAYLLSSYFKVGVLPVKYLLPATFETFGFYPLRGIPKTVQRVEPIRSKLSTHPVPPRRASGSFRPCARAARNTDNADSLNLHLRCSRDFSNRFCNENIITPVHLPGLCTMI